MNGILVVKGSMQQSWRKAGLLTPAQLMTSTKILSTNSSTQWEVWLYEYQY